MILGGAALVMSAACSQDLDVQNTTAPDVQRALANPGDVQNLAHSSVQAAYKASTYYDPWTMLNVTGDVMTANFGNFGMRFNNLEPRIPFANDAANADDEASQRPWDRLYGALGSANSAMKAINGGIVLPDGTDQSKALALWVQGEVFMELGLIYDQAFVVDETFDPTAGTPDFLPYNDVIAAATSKLDATIALTAGKDWTYDATVMPTFGFELDAEHINRIANTQAAFALAYAPRNKADAAKVDWSKVASYASKGIGHIDGGDPFDFSIDADNNTWFSYLVGYFDLPSWLGVDQHLIHKMAPCVPDKFDGTFVLPNCAHDARLAVDTSGEDVGLGQPHTSGADFIYGGQVQGDPTRGIYMQSPYYHERYLNTSFEANESLGNTPWMLAAESDLIYAKALIHSGGDRNLAATLINYTRVGRGKLTPMTALNTDDEFDTAIQYEIEVECAATDGFGFFAARQMDDLQTGTVRHLPVPAAELETLSLPIYTFGGADANPSGMNLIPRTAAGTGKLLRSLTPGRTADLQMPNGNVMKLQIPSRSSTISRPAIKY
jgi:hypothetical protein